MTFILSCSLALFLAFSAALVKKNVPRQALLLGASYVFYQNWGASFLIVLMVSSIGNYLIGAWLRRQPQAGRLSLGILFNILLLGLFKYLPAIPGTPDYIHSVVMPAGMSFWTFQALSYLFDVYHEVELDPSLLEFSLFMAFWPTVLMGPVCRLPKMLPQFRENIRFSAANFSSGMQRVGIGLFMKLILAQLLGSALAGFNETGRVWNGLDVWAIALGFGFQLFFDFAGYSNVVIGAAQVFGYRLEENFDSPYLSLTPSAFWTRWHMSLSSWIRDYVFVPIAALRRQSWWRYAALIISMTLFGLWHGAKLTFVLWGAYQGTFLALHRTAQQFQRRFNFSISGAMGDVVAWGITFLGITLGWVLFRANDFPEAAAMYRAVFSLSSYGRMELPRNYYGLLITLIGGYFAYHTLLNSAACKRIRNFLQTTNPDPLFLQLCWQKRWWGLAPMILVFIIFAGLMVKFQSAGITPFIYAGF